MNIQDVELQEALDNQADYTMDFNEKIKSIAVELGDLLGITKYKIHHDMNYAAGQSIEFRINRFLKREIWISSKGEFYTYGKRWRVYKVDTRIDSKMRELGYQLVDKDILDEIVPGKITELDGKPAKVFEVLFSELY